MDGTQMQGLIPPMLSEILIIANIVLSLIMLAALIYLWTTRGNEAQFKRLDTRIKKFSDTVKSLEDAIQNLKPQKIIEMPAVAPFGINLGAVRDTDSESVIDISDSQKNFVDGYNKVAANVNSDACQSFVTANKLRLFVYDSVMTFLSTVELEDSNYWAWKIPEQNLYAVVPNPLIPCTEEIHEQGGLKIFFETNFKGGICKIYYVQMPALFTENSNGNWIMRKLGSLILKG